MALPAARMSAPGTRPLASINEVGDGEVSTILIVETSPSPSTPPIVLSVSVLPAAPSRAEPQFPAPGAAQVWCSPERSRLDRLEEKVREGQDLRRVQQLMNRGAGVHTDRAWVGVVGSGDLADVNALSDAVNVTARLASLANKGEVYVSEQAYAAAGLSEELEKRLVELKGRGEPLDVRILQVLPEVAIKS